MSGKQPGEVPLPWEDVLDPRLLDPRLHGHAHIQQDDTLLSPSPYNTDAHSQDVNPNAASSRQMKDYPPYNEHNDEQRLVSPEHSPSQQGSSDISQQPSHPQHDHPHQHYQSSTGSAEQMSSSTENHFRPSTSMSNVATEYCADLAAVSGVQIPSKWSPLKKPLQPSNVPQSRSPTCFCPVCGIGYAQRSEVWSHFVACVALNGNPRGVCWDDEVDVTSSKVWQPSQRTKERNDKLDAVNGVVIPSKLAEGESPWTSSSLDKSGTPRDVSCLICNKPFNKRDHLKSHFPTCVNLNGNPHGLTWDHGLPKLKRGPQAKK